MHHEAWITGVQNLTPDSLSMSLGEPTIKVGDKMPADVVVHIGFAGNTPSAPQKLGGLLAGKKVLLVSLPGAFTPT